MAETPRRHWLLRLVPPVPGGRWIAAAIILTVLPATYWAIGMFSPEAGDRFTTSGLMFFAVILAYIIPVYHYISERTKSAFAELNATLELPEHLSAWEHTIDHKTLRSHLQVLGWSTLAWVSHASLLYGSPRRMLAASTGSIVDATVVVSTALVWITMTGVIFALIHNAVVFKRLATHLTVDLMRTDQLTPFGRVGVISTLALIGALAAFPLLWLDGDSQPASFLPGIIAVAIPMVFLFLLPVWPIHRAIVGAKTAELNRVNRMIHRLGARPPETPEGFDRLNPLLVYRREITQVPEWPFNTSIITRLALYLVIPPLTWVGAALIENLVDAFL